jgi:hypothetical protein
MKLIYILLLSSLVIIYSGCKERTETRKDLISIDMNQYEKVDFNSMIKSVSSIKLKHDSIPTFEYCHKIIQNNNYYYLLVHNRTGYEVLIFDDSGELVNQIAFKDLHYFINTMFIHSKENQLWIICEQNSLYKYKLDGTFLEKTSLPISCVEIAELNDQNFLVYDGGFNMDWEHNIALTNMKNVEKFFLRKNKNMPKSFLQNIFTSGTGNNDIYVFPKMVDTIYHYNTKEKMMEPFCHLNFHGDFLTEKMIPKDRYFSDKEMSDIITEKKYIYAHGNFKKASNKLFFSVSGKRNNYYIINLTDNSLKYFDTLFDGYISRDSFLGSNGEDLLMVTKEGLLASYYRNKESSYPSFQEEMSKMSEEGNSWVLLNIKIKE